MKNLTIDQQRMLAFLQQRGIATSKEIQDFLGKSQSSISRFLLELPDQVVRIGHARSTHYSIRKSIHGLPDEHPLYWTDVQGRTRPLGTLAFLANETVYVRTDHFDTISTGRLPWFLDFWKVEGFLGRIQAQRLSSIGLPDNLDRWSVEDVLHSALVLNNHQGAFELGDLSEQSPSPLVHQGASLASDLDRLAVDVAQTLPAGSSAGGEQPKFLGTLVNDKGGEARHILVKFSPPKGTPFGDRWHDLLCAEALASAVLNDHGIPAAADHFVATDQRSYLISQRFDRVGFNGRRHVVSLGAVHDGLLSERYANWSSTAASLARRNRLSADDASRVADLLHFGRLIGNTDMHSGNLSFFVDLDKIENGHLALAPAYDMLPMRWKPNIVLRESMEYSPFVPDDRALGSPVATAALDFWRRLSDHGAVSQGLREVAAEMAKRIAF